MDRLLTQKDLAERWQVTVKAIEKYRREGLITAIPGLPSVRFNPHDIEELEGTKLERFSPLERRRLERENEELRRKLEIAESVIAKVQIIINEAMYIKIKDT